MFDVDNKRHQDLSWKEKKKKNTYNVTYLSVFKEIYSSSKKDTKEYNNLKRLKQGPFQASPNHASQVHMASGAC